MNKNKTLKDFCSYTLFSSFLNSVNEEQLYESETFVSWERVFSVNL